MTYEDVLARLKNIKFSAQAKIYAEAEFKPRLEKEALADIEMCDIAIKAVERLKRQRDNKPPVQKKCICGRKQLHHWHITDGSGLMYLECPICGRSSEKVKYKTKLNAAWNKMIDEETQKNAE